MTTKESPDATHEQFEHDRLDVPPWQVYIRPDLAREFTLRAFDALRGPGRHLERLLDAALACEAAGLDPVQVLDRAMDAAALAEVELLAQAEGLLQKMASKTAEER